MLFQYITIFLGTFITFLTLSNFLLPKNINNSYYVLKNETYYIINCDYYKNTTSSMNLRATAYKIIDSFNQIKIHNQKNYYDQEICKADEEYIYLNQTNLL